MKNRIPRFESMRASVHPAVRIGKPEDRTMLFRVTDETPDRYNTRIKSNGWDFSEYLPNPVFMWAHNYEELSVGDTLKMIRREGQPKKPTMALVKFHEKELYPFADTVFRFYDGGHLRGTSVGFDTLEQLEIDGREERAKLGFVADRPAFDLTKNRLWEISAAPVPGNPAALTEQLAAEADGYRLRIPAGKYDPNHDTLGLRVRWAWRELEIMRLALAIEGNKDFDNVRKRKLVEKAVNEYYTGNRFACPFPFASFDECVAEVSQGDAADPAAVCGAWESECGKPAKEAPMKKKARQSTTVGKAATLVVERRRRKIRQEEEEEEENTEATRNPKRNVEKALEAAKAYQQAADTLAARAEELVDSLEKLAAGDVEEEPEEEQAEEEEEEEEETEQAEEEEDEEMEEEEEEGRGERGTKLAATLNEAIDAMATGEGEDGEEGGKTRADIIGEIATAAGIDEATVNQILDGEIDCPPEDRLEGFASVLDLSMETLLSRAREDGCTYGEEGEQEDAHDDEEEEEEEEEDQMFIKKKKAKKKARRKARHVCRCGGTRKRPASRSGRDADDAETRAELVKLSKKLAGGLKVSTKE